MTLEKLKALAISDGESNRCQPLASCLTVEGYSTDWTDHSCWGKPGVMSWGIQVLRLKDRLADLCIRPCSEKLDPQLKTLKETS
ncbi:uncharacterized protein [Gorilla gorilla gorilla]|uniref:uncharacterized protein isoform X1 n=1 Tax=Gorilla gorilla gorilla TaxID=9595 RepID=UPI0030086D36